MNREIHIIFYHNFSYFCIETALRLQRVCNESITKLFLLVIVVQAAHFIL